MYYVVRGQRLAGEALKLARLQQDISPLGNHAHGNNNCLYYAHFPGTGHGSLALRGFKRHGVGTRMEGHDHPARTLLTQYDARPNRGLAVSSSFGSSYLLHVRGLREPSSGGSQECSSGVCRAEQRALLCRAARLVHGCSGSEQTKSSYPYWN